MFIIWYCHHDKGVTWWRTATERSQVRVPAAPLHVHFTTIGKLFTHACLCSPSSLNWYRYKLGAKQAFHATH